MQIGAFYSTARTYAEKIKKEKPIYGGIEGTSLCMIMADNQEIYSAISSININEGNVDDVHSERIAIAEIIAANRVAKQMVIISFDELNAVLPCDECLDMLIRANAVNGQCEIATSAEDSTSAISLQAMITSVSEEFLSGKDENKKTAATLGAPAEFVSGFEFDKSNPFYEDSAKAEKPANTIADNGFSQQQMMYGQQQMMYSQQGSFGQQQFYGQQAGFPQQQFGQQGGFPQQQFGQQGGFPQQQFAQQNQSVHISDVIGAAHNKFKPDQVVSQYSDSGDSVMKKRLASLLGEDLEEEKSNNATMSREELVKQSKEMKKAAKQSSRFRKQF